MDEHGIEMMILSLNAPAVQAIPDPRKAIEVARRANDFLAEQCASGPDRFQGFAALPMQDPDAATRELQRCVKELGFNGALVNGFSQVDDPTTPSIYDLPQYRPFWAAVEELDVPFYLHPRNPLPQRRADLRRPSLAARPDLGLRAGDGGARAAADGLGPVRRVSAAADRARPHGRGPALQHVARRQPQRLGQDAAQAIRPRRSSPTTSTRISTSPRRATSAPRR